MQGRIYDININKLAAWLTPGKVKQPRVLNWIRSLLYPFNLLYISFLKYRKDKLYQLSITPQVCYLTRLLNDRYDYTRRRITVVDSIDKDPVYIYRRDELKPRYIFKKTENRPKFIYTYGESGLIRDDFIIKIPVALFLAGLNTRELSSLVNVYKLAGTKFRIQFLGR
jgi:hypothetical protein